MRVLTEVSPGRISELLHYQATIVEAHNNYGTEAWLAHDRRPLSVRPHAVSWAIIDANLPLPVRSSQLVPDVRKFTKGQAPFAPFVQGPHQHTLVGANVSTSTMASRCVKTSTRCGLCSGDKCSRAHVCSSCCGSHP